MSFCVSLLFYYFFYFCLSTFSDSPTKYSVYDPISMLQPFKTFKIPEIPLWKFIMADETPVSKTSLLTKISFGHRFHITPFNDSLLLGVFPCKHFF